MTKKIKSEIDAFIDYFGQLGGMNALLPSLARFAENGFDTAANGNLPRWLEALDELPDISGACEVTLDSPTPSVAFADPAPTASNEFEDTLRKILQKFHPWRKGPFNLFGVEIDAEWRSNLKWERLRSRISPLRGRVILDVGCGNGYYGLRMAGEGAAAIVGIDNGLGAATQFQALNKYFKAANLAVFPASIDDLPESLELFDTVFSMGMLYHRKKPLEHLERLRSFLKPCGECVLETIVVDGGPDDCLVPPGRYARMRNIYYIPTVKLIKKWLKSSGFDKIKVVDVSPTTTDEQRSTPWMTYNSLSDFLDPNDDSKTIEGHPAPKRAIISARKK
ncbi:MAG: tRNA 5-methoxyuridine(34)/uridine 5-oxyacetic acid(34) synthase CmoB [Victivallales bacterium]|nr:tRNA 5-methoxyuridine(34)/uridine 5-oxyacetic acid(34) synthase CmoB [Victivallales bacterium]